MSPLQVADFLTPMKREGEALSIESLNAQVNAMMLAICLIEDEDSRIQFMKRIELVQKDLYGLRSQLESNMPKKLEQPSTLDIDHSLHLMSLTKKNWQNVQDITRRIDRLSEGLALVVQRHRDSRRSQASRSNEDPYLHSDYKNSEPYTQDNIQHSTYSKSTGGLNSGRNYSFEYSRSKSDGQQVQIFFSHAKRYYPPSSNSQADQFARGPNYINPQSINMSHYDRRFSTSPPSQLEDARNHSCGYFTEYPRSSFYVPFSPSLKFKGRLRDDLSYLPGGRLSQHSGPSSQTSNMPYPGSMHGYPRNYPRATGVSRSYSDYS